MKKLLSTILIFSFCKLSLASDIDCYSSGNRIYHGSGHSILLDENNIAFIDDKSNKIVYINSPCIVKWSEKEFDAWLDDQSVIYTDYLAVNSDTK